jgi:hypothetical protein
VAGKCLADGIKGTLVFRGANPKNIYSSETNANYSVLIGREQLQE